MMSRNSRKLLAAQAALDLKTITDHDTPWQRALAMAMAIESFLDLVWEDEDAGEEGASTEDLEDAHEDAQQLTNVLRRIARRR